MKRDHFEDQEGAAVNPSSEPGIGELISRRALLKGMAAGGAFGLFGCATSAASRGATDGSAPLGFTEIGRTKDDKHHVAPGYTAQVLIRQGDPIRRGAPQYRPGQQTGAEQERSSAPTTISSPTCRCRAAPAARRAGCSA